MLSMIEWCKDLFPICRSITGPGIKQTLSYFEKINPELKRLKFKSGTKVFDWIVPDEWSIKEAYILDKYGKKHADFKKNNLHVVNFSSPIKKKISKKNLLNNLHTSNISRNAIPYVTKYYKRSWGFCISKNQLQKIPNGNLKIHIDSKFSKGYLDLSHAIIKGRHKKEIFFSSYVCHPSMANNELSGPVVLNALLKYVNKLKNRKYTYRFVLLPETIGSICYLSKYYKYLKKNVIMGYNLSCLGDSKAYSIIKGPNQPCLSFDAIYSILKNKKNLKIYSYLERGSDERQYCSPGIDLPVTGFCRSKYNMYKEYHTSLDNLEIINENNLKQSLNILKRIVDVCELSLFPKTQILCEPFLSKRNLHTENTKYDFKNRLSKDMDLRKNLLSFSNGKRSIFEISNILNVDIDDLCKELKLLIKHSLIK